MGGKFGPFNESFRDTPLGNCQLAHRRSRFAFHRGETHVVWHLWISFTHTRGVCVSVPYTHPPILKNEFIRGPILPPIGRSRGPRKMAPEGASRRFGAPAKLPRLSAKFPGPIFSQCAVRTPKNETRCEILISKFRRLCAAKFRNQNLSKVVSESVCKRSLHTPPSFLKMSFFHALGAATNCRQGSDASLGCSN